MNLKNSWKNWKRSTHKKHFGAILAATVLFVVCVWQIDLWVSPHVYDNPHFLLIALGFGMPNTLAYDLGIVGLFLAYFGALAALWKWD